MEIKLQSAGKKFGRSWIFRGLDYAFSSGGRYAILGGNGSGKSTLLQIIAGYQGPSEGKIRYADASGKEIPADRIYARLTIATPYMELPEEFSLEEFLLFHGRFKKALFSLDVILEKLGLEKERQKEIRNFSSGMRQRVRLGTALLYESDMILLDEPTTHLDHRAIAWYQELLKENTGNRILIISSNQPEEYALCNEHIEVEKFKPVKK